MAKRAHRGKVLIGRLNGHPIRCTYTMHIVSNRSVYRFHKLTGIRNRLLRARITGGLSDKTFRKLSALKTDIRVRIKEEAPEGHVFRRQSLFCFT